MAKGRNLAEIGERLRITRQALGKTQVAFCKAPNIEPNTYNQHERGRSRPGIGSALALCNAHRLSLDWIYLGDDSNLPASLSETIKKMRAARQL